MVNSTPGATSAERGTRGYFRNTWLDLRAIAADVREHPGNWPQDLLALFVSLGTVRGERLAGPGRFAFYSGARGLGAWIPKRGRHTAITFGCLAFAHKPVAKFSALYWHEQTHYLQAIEEGWLWGIRYFRESRRHGYQGNRFEVEAYARGPRGAGRDICEWRDSPPSNPSRDPENWP